MLTVEVKQVEVNKWYAVSIFPHECRSSTNYWSQKKQRDKAIENL